MTFTDEQYKEMAAAYTEGETLAKLADAFGVSVPTMSKYVFKGGARIRPRGQRKGSKTVKSVPKIVPNTPEINQALDAMEEAAMSGYYEPGTDTVVPPTTRVILPLE